MGQLTKKFEDMEYFPISEQLVKILLKKTHSIESLFFRVSIAYHFAKLASMMHTNIQTEDRGIIPVSLYALNLAPSGFGKGLSNNIIEEHITAEFKEVYMTETFPQLAEQQLIDLANYRALKNHTEPEHELNFLQKEFENTGSMVFNFDSATPAAIKQIRHKILLAGTGALSLEMDEVGSNFIGQTDALNTFIELYDVGKVKEKITLNSSENKRRLPIDGRTPTNMMLFGTPTKLLDGGKTEEEFYKMLETGYARRLLFGYADKAIKTTANSTAEELYDIMTDSSTDLTLSTISHRLKDRANLPYYNQVLNMRKEVTIELINYQIYCNRQADLFKEHQEIQKAEYTHRYFKALKLAGAYAFIDGSTEITIDHLHNAIKLLEDSGAAFQKIMQRDKPYVRLAKYIAAIEKDITQVDLVEDLPFYRGSVAQKTDMMNLAIAYGYKNNIIIKKRFIDGIEFLRGESLQPTNLNEVIVSYSTDLAYNYLGKTVPFKQLYELTTASGYHYTAHMFTGSHRQAENAIPGFNLVIIDIDKNVSIDMAESLLKDYTFLLSTTKRHTDSHHRFRIILPLSHHIKLESKEYSQFMLNVFNWLPFEVDENGKDIARKWEGYDGTYIYNEGTQLLDATLFIPSTKKSEDQNNLHADIHNLTNLERWFLANTGEGNRNNMLLKYALALVDSNYDYESISAMLMSFNSKLPEPLDITEITSQILVTVAKKLGAKELD